MSNLYAGLGQPDFQQAAQSLLPRGAAWPRSAMATQTGYWAAVAAIMADVHAHAALLSEVESDPRQAVLLLPDWESAFGLPDPCVGRPLPTLQQRRAALLARITDEGGQSPARFVALAALLGYAITITEYRPFRCGLSGAGSPLGGVGWMFTWQVNAPAATVRYFSCGASAAGEPLASWGNRQLECELNRLKPAHTILLFSYGAFAPGPPPPPLGPIASLINDGVPVDFGRVTDPVVLSDDFGRCSIPAAYAIDCGSSV